MDTTYLLSYTTTSEPATGKSTNGIATNQPTNKYNNNTVSGYLDNKIEQYKTAIATTITKKHLVYFFVVIILIQVTSDYVSNYFPKLEIFQPVFISGLFSVISGVESYYEYIFGGVISATIAYTLTRIFFDKLQTSLQKILLRSTTALIIIITMVLFGAFSPSSLSYSFQALKLYPTMNLGYIYSYVNGLIISALFVYVYLRIINDISAYESTT
jgi:hypothetical protein